MSLRVRRCGANPSQRVTLTITSERKGWTLSEYGVGTYPFPAYSSRPMSLWLFSALDNCRLRQPHRYTIGFETLCVETGSDTPVQRIGTRTTTNKGFPLCLVMDAEGSMTKGGEGYALTRRDGE